MIWFSPDVIEKCFLCLFSREEKNLKIFPAPGRENMSQSDPLWCIREVCLMAFSGISQITVFKSPGFSISFMQLCHWGCKSDSHISVLILLGSSALSLDSVKLSRLTAPLFHEHDNDAPGSPPLFLVAPSQAGGMLLPPPLPRCWFLLGTGPLTSSCFACSRENLAYSHCFNHPLLQSYFQIHLRPIWSFGSLL